MLILYPNYSLEIVGNYLAFPFQVVLLVSFKSKFILTQISTLWSFQCSALLSKLVRSQRTSLLYRMSFNLSRTFFNFFRSVFSVHFHASQCLVYDVVLFLRVSLTAWLSYQRYTPLSTDFCIFFCLFLISFLQGFYAPFHVRKTAAPDPLQTLALASLQEEYRGLRSREKPEPNRRL